MSTVIYEGSDVLYVYEAGGEAHSFRVPTTIVGAGQEFHQLMADGDIERRKAIIEALGI